MTFTTPPPQPPKQTRTTVMGIILALALCAGLTTLLYVRSGTSANLTAKTPLPVASTAFTQQLQYQRNVSYLGLIEAHRRTNVGFETPGLLSIVHVREGSKVQTGDVLAELDTAKLIARRQATAAEQQSALAELELARIKEKRQQDLRRSGAVSREAYDETRLRTRALAAQTEMVQAQLDSIDIDLRKSVIRAPYQGVIAEHFIDVGTVVTPGTPIVKLIEAARREAHIGVPVKQAQALNSGTYYALTLRGSTFDARLIAVHPDVNPATRAVTAVFEIPEDNVALDGEPVTLKLTQAVHMTGGWLPISALLEGERGVWTVLKIIPDAQRQVAVREAVEVLEILGNKAYVRGTISDGDTLVADGIHRITPGSAVTLAQVN